MFENNKLENEYNKTIRKIAELFYRDGTYSKEVLEFINDDIVYNLEMIEKKYSSDIDKLRMVFEESPEQIHKVCLKNKDDSKVIFRNFNNDDKMVVTKTSHVDREKNGKRMLELFIDNGYELVEVVYKKDMSE